MNQQQYIKQSLELHLFFLRIMKEHSFFLEAALLPKNQNLIREARFFNNKLDALLKEAIRLSNGVIPIRDDAVTNYTFDIEQKTEKLIGIPIDSEITKMEMNFSSPKKLIKSNNQEEISNLNNRVIDLIEKLILYKTKILNAVLDCTLFTANYPQLIIHIRSEALEYINQIRRLQTMETESEIINQELFWNNIMGEHAEFIRGYLDPTETDLMSAANKFAVDYKNINKEIIAAKKTHNLEQSTNASLELTAAITNFKTQATNGLLNCKIKSIIIPLLGDHVLREANHYQKILNSFQKEKTK